MNLTQDQPLAQLGAYPQLTNITFIYLSAAIIALLSFAVPILLRSKGGPPIINPPKTFEFGPARVVGEFINSAWETLYRSARAPSAKPFRVYTEIGLVTVLNPEQGEEIRNDRRFSFVQVLADMFQAKLPGFEPYAQAMADWEPVQNLVKQKITRNLPKMITVLAEVCDETSVETLGNSHEWQSVVLKQKIADIVSRMSSRIFVGEKLYQNEQWNKLILSYGMESAMEADQLKLWPKFLRPFVIWTRPTSTRLRVKVKEAEDFIRAQLEERKSQGNVQEFEDAIQGFEDLAKGRPYNAGATQLMLAIVAIMTTADLLTQALLDIIEHPELIQPLREEMISALSEHGWTKNAFSQMKLLDSVLKESQRLKPAQISGMHRKPSTDVTLKDGTRIAAGTTTTVSAERMWDPSVYSDPETFDGYRFYNLRKSCEGHDGRYQLVGTSIDHMGFGHGRHSCPGRFFATEEAKIALCFLLLRYDWNSSNGSTPVIQKFGFFHESDHSAKVSVRRRKSGYPLWSGE